MRNRTTSTLDELSDACGRAEAKYLGAVRTNADRARLAATARATAAQAFNAEAYRKLHASEGDAWDAAGPAHRADRSPQGTLGRPGLRIRGVTAAPRLIRSAPSRQDTSSWQPTAVVHSRLRELVQDQLKAVTFNQKGVVLQFGDARFTVHSWPTVRVGGSTFNLGDPGYRDAVCALITHKVTGTDEVLRAGLVITFGRDSIMVNPAPTDLSGPEIAQLVIYDPMNQTRHLAVWQAGQTPFTGPAWS